MGKGERSFLFFEMDSLHETAHDFGLAGIFAFVLA